MATSNKVTIAEATHDDLFVFVTTQLGITELKEGITLLELKAKANEAGFNDKHKIDVVAVTVPNEGGKGKIKMPVEQGNEHLGQTEADAEEDPWEQFMVITIQRSEKPGGDRPVYVNCNGRPIWLPRGEPIKVKRKHVHILSQAVEDVYDERQDGTGLGTPRPVQVYPFSIMHHHVAA